MTGYVCIHTVNFHNATVKGIKYLSESTKELLTQFIWKPSGCRVKHGALQRNEGCSRCYGPAPTMQRCSSEASHFFYSDKSIGSLWICSPCISHNDPGLTRGCKMSTAMTLMTRSAESEFEVSGSLQRWVQLNTLLVHQSPAERNISEEHQNKTPGTSVQPRIKTKLPKLKRQTHRGTNCTSEWELHIHSVDILHQSGESSWQLFAQFWKTYHS